MDVGLVCDSCSTFNAMGAAECGRCHGSLSLDGAAAAASAPPRAATAQQAAAGRTCSVCQAAVAPGHTFCGACGSKMFVEPAAELAAQAPKAAPPKTPATKQTLFFGAMQASRAKLVLIKGDGLDGVSFTLAGTDHILGRVDAPLLFEEDPFLSPQHANFTYRAGQLVVVDLGSTNGVYLRLRGSTDLQFGDQFLVGEQLLRVDSVDTATPQAEPDGTYFFTSPVPQAPFQITQQLRGGNTGLIYRAKTPTVSLGRDANDINFPDDPFISGHHASVSANDGRLLLTDLDSKNGTFVKIHGERMLNHGDYVFMGQQLLRVEIV